MESFGSAAARAHTKDCCPSRFLARFFFLLCLSRDEKSQHDLFSHQILPSDSENSNCDETPLRFSSRELLLVLKLATIFIIISSFF